MSIVTAFVPIRLNSSRLPGKSALPLHGKPLLQYLLETLTQVSNIDRVCVFCSDERIADYLPQGVDLVLRPTSLDGNFTLGIEIYRAFLSAVKSDYYVLAHVTSPFLKPETVHAAVDSVIAGRHDSAFTVRAIQTFCWYAGRPLNYDLEHVRRTQDLEPVYAETSAFYVFPRGLMEHEGRRIGDNPYFAVTDFPEDIDIDTEADFMLAEAYLSAKPQNKSAS